MKPDIHARVAQLLQLYANAASLAVVSIGIAVISGWFLDIPLLKSFLPNLPAMRFNTALSLLLLGSSLWFLKEERPSSSRKRIGQMLVSLVLLLSLLSLIEYLFGRNLGIDEFFVRDMNESADLYPGRMAPLAILCASLSGISLLALNSRITRYFCYTVAALSFLVILNNLFDFQLLARSTPANYVPVHSGVAFLLLSLGILAARPTRELIGIFSSDLPGSRAMRQLFLGIIVLMTVMAWLVEMGESSGILDSTKESMVLVLLLIFAYSPLIYFIARNINQAEMKLLLSNQILERVNTLVLVADAQGSITYVSPSVKTILGFEPAELLGDGWWKLDRLDSSGDAERARIVRDVSQGGNPGRGSYERAIQDRWGHKHWIMWVDALGPDSSIIGVGHDITERKKNEQALRESEARYRGLSEELEQRVLERIADLNRVNMELEKALRTKDEFLAIMSHELRTPLNSILGLSEILLDELRGPLNEYQQRSLHTIESSGNHLLALISDILELSKIEAGKLEIRPEPIDVLDLCESSLAFVTPQAAKKSITLEFLHRHAAHMIVADPRSLKQILVNLLSNAVKFTPQGGHVTLEVTTDEENELIQFSVSDTGIGIEAKNLSNLFQPFVQVDSRLNRQFEGTGLGLALVQRFTDLHGGSVHVVSEPGLGSRFTINLPWRLDLVSAEPPASTEDAIETSGAARIGETSGPIGREDHHALILLAEDNPANVLTVKEYLESYGYEVVVARNGLEAITAASARSPQLILMDIQMPVMNGLEATQRLRADPRFQDVPIIALTALAMPGDRDRCMEAGATEYLSKPVILKQLVKMIRDLVRA